MGLVIRFAPGVSVTIDGIKFAVEFGPPRLLREGHQPILIHIAEEPALPDVRVHLAFRQEPGFLAIAFDAPGDTLIIRNLSENVL
jgi:hypothetical protein